MKKSTFLLLRLFVVAGLLSCLLAMLPYAHALLLVVKEKATQMCQPVGNSDQLATESTYALR